MQVRAWPSLVVTTAFCCFAFLSGLYGFLVPEQLSFALLAAIFFLIGAQISAIGFSWLSGRKLSDAFWVLKKDQHQGGDKNFKNFVRMEDFNRDIANIDQQIQELKLQSHRNFDPIPPVATPTHYQDFSQNYQAHVANQPNMVDAVGAMMRTAAEPALEQDELLQFMLEPVIDLTTRKTAHYRAQVTMAGIDGHEIDYATLVSNADQNGLRTSLDSHFVSQAVPILRRLRLRHPSMEMFIPIGVASLRTAATIDYITQQLFNAPDIASGFVFEIAHASMAELGEEGITGLAALARAGATMALMQSTVSGLDLISLAQLNMQYIGVNANSIDMGHSFAPAWRDFVETARSLKLQILLTDVYDAQQAASAGQIARFVSGSFFAPPRRVRSYVGVAASPLHSAAA